MFANYTINRFNRAFLSKLSQYFLVILSIITVLSVFVPLIPVMPLSVFEPFPGMPPSGLDPSWMITMNEAIAHHFAIGKEIIFTFGPYAFIYTKLYSPETDTLMVFSSLFLGLCYAAILLYLAKGKKNYRLLAILFYLAGFISSDDSSFVFSRDALLFSYPLILVACIFEFIGLAEQNNQKQSGITQILIAAIIFAPLGLLPLIKGSFLVLCMAYIFAIASYFFYYRYRVFALLIFISPIVSMTVFWLLSGQSLLVLPDYITSFSPIISGYTEAMSLLGKTSEILAYLLATTAILWQLVRSTDIAITGRLFLGFCFLLFLFIVFKSGFVRHDIHANLAATALVFAVLTFNFVSTKSNRIMTLLVCLMASTYISKNHVNITLFDNLHSTYANIWNGLYLRLNESNKLRQGFNYSLNRIKEKYAIPTLHGTTDIYPFHPVRFFASNNNWNPRPIIQSYSAYTAVLAKINEQHLRTDNAPDNILLSIQTLDERHPALDDGLSWSALLDNYTVNKIDRNFAYLNKKPVLQKNSLFQDFYDETHEIGETVVIPETDLPIYAEVDIKPTILGKLISLLYKPPQLIILLNLNNGTSHYYRVVGNMMVSGFFISPLIKDTKDFVHVSTGELRYLNNHIVKSFAIFPSYGGSVFWNANYQLKLKTYINNTLAKTPPLNDMIDMPNNYSEAKAIQCNSNQFIDIVNGTTVTEQIPKVTRQLTVDGWLAFSAKDGIVADETFVTLTNYLGDIKYLTTQATPRHDVKVFFKQHTMPDIGFTSTVDVTHLQGVHTLGLARAYAGKLEHCLEIAIPVMIEPVKPDESKE